MGILLGVGCENLSPVLSLGTLTPDAGTRPQPPSLRDAGLLDAGTRPPRPRRPPDAGPGVDLRLVRLYPVSESLTLGETTEATVDLETTGPVPASTTVQIQFRHESQDILAEAGRVAVPLPAEPAGETMTVTVTVTVPPTLDPGPYYLQAALDPDQVIAEADETNNRRTVGPSWLGAVRVHPAPVDFGVVGTGCIQTRNLTVTHHGVGPNAWLTAPWTPASAAPFDVDDNALPTDLPLETPINLPVTYAPTEPGVHERILSVATRTETVPVRVRGTAVNAPQRIETFAQWPAERLDVLVVLYDGPSMVAAQNDVLSGAADFVTALRDRHIDFRLMVTTADVSATGAQGTPLGAPSVLHPAQTDGSHRFTLRLQRPNTGNAESRGLDAIARVLAAPPEDFLRPEASLLILVLSNRDDTSTARVAEVHQTLTDHFQHRNGDFMVAALVPTPDTPCGAPVGNRYLDLAQQSAGGARPLCTFAWATMLDFIDVPGFGYQTRFDLGHVPRPDSLRVWVDDRKQAIGFGYDPDARQLVFEAPATPAPQASIRVRYDSDC